MNGLFVWVPKTAGISIYQHFRSTKSISFIKDGKIEGNLYKNKVITFGHSDMDLIIKNRVVSKVFYSIAFKFSFVRNPFDRMVSYFLSMRSNKDGWFSTFPEFCRALKYMKYESVPPIGLYNTLGLSQMNPQVRWLKTPVDFVGRFENLDEDFNKVLSILGEPATVLPHVNVNRTTDSWQEYYEPECVDIVRTFYKEDFLTFGYPESF